MGIFHKSLVRYQFSFTVPNFFPAVPIGGVSLTAVLLLLKASPPLGADLTKRSPKDIFQQVLRLDFGGAILVAGAVTSLVLALQWGGNTKPWDDKAVIIVSSCDIIGVDLS
jgi:hypothetical protein